MAVSIEFTAFFTNLNQALQDYRTRRTPGHGVRPFLVEQIDERYTKTLTSTNSALTLEFDSDMDSRGGKSRQPPSYETLHGLPCRLHVSSNEVINPRCGFDKVDLLPQLKRRTPPAPPARQTQASGAASRARQSPRPRPSNPGWAKMSESRGRRRYRCTLFSSSARVRRLNASRARSSRA